MSATIDRPEAALRLRKPVVEFEVVPVFRSPLVQETFDRDLEVDFNNFSERTTTRWGSLLFRKVLFGTMSFSTHLTARIANFLLAPASVFPCAVDTIAGLEAGALSIATFGLDSPTVNFAARELHAAGALISKPFEFLVRVINPKADFRDKGFQPQDSDIMSALAEIPVAGTLGLIANKLAQSEYILARNISSRIAYAFTAITAVVARVFLGVLALPTTVLSVATFGSVRQINAFASIGLQAPAVITDLVLCSIKIINPQAGEPMS